MSQRGRLVKKEILSNAVQELKENVSDASDFEGEVDEAILKIVLDHERVGVSVSKYIHF